MHVHLSICVFVHPYVCASLYLVLAVAFSLPKASLTYILVSWLRRCLVGRRKQSLEHSAFFFHLCLYFKAFSKLFISPWCCRKEVIRDAKQKVTHIPPLPVFYFLKPFFSGFPSSPVEEKDEILTHPCAENSEAESNASFKDFDFFFIEVLMKTSTVIMCNIQPKTIWWLDYFLNYNICWWIKVFI